MFEEAFGNALQNLNSTVLGSVLVIVLVAFVWTIRVMRSDLKECQAELRGEQAAHQKTREAHLADIRNFNHVTTSLEGVQTAIARLEDRVVDNAFRRRGQ